MKNKPPITEKFLKLWNLSRQYHPPSLTFQSRFLLYTCLSYHLEGDTHLLMKSKFLSIQTFIAR